MVHLVRLSLPGCHGNYGYRAVFCVGYALSVQYTVTDTSTALYNTLLLTMVPLCTVHFSPKHAWDLTDHNNLHVSSS